MGLSFGSSVMLRRTRSLIDSLSKSRPPSIRKLGTRLARCLLKRTIARDFECQFDRYSGHEWQRGETQ